MNYEFLEKRGLRLIASYIHGSQAYGLDTADSDIDERLVYMCSNKQILADSLVRFIEKNDDTRDLFAQELSTFLRQLCHGNFNALDLIYSPWDCVGYQSQVMKALVDQRSVFVTKKSLYSLVNASARHLEETKPKKLVIGMYWVNKAKAVLSERDWVVRLDPGLTEALRRFKTLSEPNTNMQRLVADTKKLHKSLEKEIEGCNLQRDTDSKLYHYLLLKIRNYAGDFQISSGDDAVHGPGAS